MFLHRSLTTSLLPKNSLLSFALSKKWPCVTHEEWMLCEQACWCVCFLFAFIWGRPLSAPALLHASPASYSHYYIHLCLSASALSSPVCTTQLQLIGGALLKGKLTAAAKGRGRFSFWLKLQLIDLNQWDWNLHDYNSFVPHSFYCDQGLHKFQIMYLADHLTASEIHFQTQGVLQIIFLTFWYRKSSNPAWFMQGLARCAGEWKKASSDNYLSHPLCTNECNTMNASEESFLAEK